MNAKDLEIQQLKLQIKELKQKQTGYVLILHHSKDVQSHQYSITEHPLDTSLELKELQEIVGGYAEDLTGQLVFGAECRKEGIAMYGNEEAVPKKLPESRWSSGEWCDVMMPYVFLRGDLVFVRVSPSGYELPLTKKQVEFLMYYGFREVFGSEPYPFKIGKRLTA